MCMDRRASAASRLDGNLTLHQLQSLSHADEPKTAAGDDILWVKTNSQVIHGQLNIWHYTAQFYWEALHATVFHGIAQTFL